MRWFVVPAELACGVAGAGRKMLADPVDLLATPKYVVRLPLNAAPNCVYQTLLFDN
jgi:hypothetical protein